MSTKEDLQDLKELFKVEETEEDYDEDAYNIVQQFKSQITGELDQ